MNELLLRRRFMAQYEEVDYTKRYLTIVSKANNNSISWVASDSSVTKTISISTDNGATWTPKTSATSGGTLLATLSDGGKLLVKGTNTGYATTYSYYNKFTTTQNVDVEGNIMSLLGGDNFSDLTSVGSYAFCNLFLGSKIVSAKNLILPATTLGTYCYRAFFSGSTLLNAVPELPALTLAEGCYYTMFYGCINLTSAPSLPATTSAESCYYGMFQGCNKITSAPSISVTALSNRCFINMFNGCTNLTSAPSLPWTTLADYCFQGMFYNCSSLKTAPTLRARTLKKYCYQNMFRGCSKLNYVKCLATTISASNCVSNWLNGVASSGTFVKYTGMSSWGSGASGIPSGWTIQNATS